MSETAEQRAAPLEAWLIAAIGLLAGVCLVVMLFPFVWSEKGVGLVIFCDAGEQCIGVWIFIGLASIPIIGALAGLVVWWARRPRA